jgi:ubiquinone/menaquinone biosynthesis C-methylase UbiE
MSCPYDRIAPRYEGAIAPLERLFLNKLRQQSLSMLDTCGRVLELGAGTGLNFRFYSPDAKGVATEPSTGMLEVAKQKTRPPELALVQNCAEELPFKEAAFDAAFATLVFCSVHSPASVFAELKRVVKKDGQIVLLEHVRPANVLGPLFDLLSSVTVPLFEDHLNRRTADEARAAGLEVVEVKKFGWGIINLILCRV